MNSTPARCLLGVQLKNGWEVVEMLEKNRPGDSGGGFSTGYIVKNSDGEVAFMKALDFSKALQSSDPARMLQSMTEAYNHERDILEKCKYNRMKRVVVPIDDGTVQAPGNFGAVGNVCYIIFEKAEGDIRQQIRALRQFDLAWCLRSLHHTATGIMQLHSKGIVHQDVKPSNVLVFRDKQSKITDLGRASDRQNAADIDSFRIPGDMGYAPIEQFYGFKVTDTFERRFGVDMYLFGSLIFFYFSSVSATQAIQSKLKCHVGPNRSKDDFVNELPYIKEAFDKALEDLRKDIEKMAGGLTDEIITIVKEMCEPDPRFRGHPKDRKMVHGQQYSFIRYVSRLNLLARKAELGLV